MSARGPIGVYMRPTTGISSAIASDAGSRTRPVSSGVTPWIVCRNTGTRKAPEYRLIVMMIETISVTR